MQKPTSQPESGFVHDFAEHADFLRALARRVVGDDQRAEDVVQEAGIAYIAQPPKANTNPRAWLGRVVRNLANNVGRSEGRRVEREAAVARPESEDLGAIPERLEVQRRLVELVSSLDQAQRTTVYLRFYEALEPREIAQRLNIPVSTVKTRLSRALELLRKKLDDSFDGGRPAWCLALAPLAGLSIDVSKTKQSLLLGAVAVNLKIAIAIAASIVVAAIWQDPFAATPVESTIDEIAVAAGTVETPRVISKSSDQTEFASGVGREEVQAVPVALDELPDNFGELPMRFPVRITDSAGVALAGASVEARFKHASGGEESVTDQDGNATLSLYPPRGLSPYASLSLLLTADSFGYHPTQSQIRQVFVGEQERTRIHIQLLPGVVATGSVINAKGELVADAKVAAVNTNGVVIGHATSREDGRFLLPLTSRSTDFTVLVTSETHGWGSVGSFSVSDSDTVQSEIDAGTVELTIGAHFEGSAQFADGRPVSNSRINYRRVGELDGTTNATVKKYAEFNWERWIIGNANEPAPGFPHYIGQAIGYVTTDEEGRFFIAGLIPGVYEFELEELSRSKTKAKYGLFATGEYVSLTVEEMRLTVQTLDQAGRPVVGVPLNVGTANGKIYTTSGGGEGTHTFPVAPGLVEIEAIAEGTVPVGAAITVLPEVNEYYVKLTIDYEPQTGGMQFNVIDELGRKIEKFEVVLMAEDNERNPRAFLLHSPQYFDPDSEGFVADVPVGDYKVRVRSNFIDSASTTWFEEELNAIVNANATTLSELEVRLGSRLHLEINASSIEFEAEMTSTEVSVDVLTLYGEMLPFTVDLFRPEGNGYRLSDPMLGSSGFTDLMEPGSYIFRFSATGYEPLERIVNLAAGEIVDVAVDLQRR